MDTDDDKEVQAEAPVDEAVETLAHGDAAEDEERDRLEELAARVEEPGLQDRVLERYQHVGRELLSDDLPTDLDPTIARRLERYLGDVSNVRIHKGAAASAAARAMGARAFALGDADVFVDETEFNPQSAPGRALLAHEIAHTRDAATGFAMSRGDGAHRGEGREAYAEEVERSFAIEDAHEEEEPADEEVASTSPGVGGRPAQREPEVDKVALEQRVMDILKRRERLDRERIGR